MTQRTKDVTLLASGAAILAFALISVLVSNPTTAGRIETAMMAGLIGSFVAALLTVAVLRAREVL